MNFLLFNVDTGHGMGEGGLGYVSSVSRLVARYDNDLLTNLLPDPPLHGIGNRKNCTELN